MTINKYFYPSKKDYIKVHSRLRRKLLKIAFDNYYQCAHCSGHDNLEIHIPFCDPAKIDEPGFYKILCNRCHKKAKTRPR
jgi:hypothetical protein